MKRMILVVLALSSFFGRSARACPSCRDSLSAPATTSPAADDLPAGFNHAIYVILGGFILVAGSASMFIVREVRRDKHF